MFDVIVVGAGIVGSLIARKLSSYQLSVAVLEKEPDVGNVVTMANSAIVHSGYDPVPGTLKAKLNVLGNKMMDKVCEELDVEMERIGSLTVALYDEQLPMLEKLALRSKENGVEVKILSAASKPLIKFSHLVLLIQVYSSDSNLGSSLVKSFSSSSSNL